MHESQQRRATDDLISIKNKILAMLEECDDKTTKIQLLIQLEFISSLSLNTSVTLHLADTLDQHINNFNTHVEKEDKLVNQFHGAKPFMLWLGRALYIIMGSLLMNIYIELTELKTTVAVHTNELSSHSQILFPKQ